MEETAHTFPYVSYLLAVDLGFCVAYGQAFVIGYPEAYARLDTLNECSAFGVEFYCRVVLFLALFAYFGGASGVGGGELHLCVVAISFGCIVDGEYAREVATFAEVLHFAGVCPHFVES